MNRKVIVHIYDDGLRIGEALRLICDGIDYDNTRFERTDCAWRLSDGHCVYVDLAKNKGSIRFNVWKEKKNEH